MKTAIQYLCNQSGEPQAVQLSISQWTRLMNKLTKYEQMLKLKSDLTKSLEEVKKMRQGKIKKHSEGITKDRPAKKTVTFNALSIDTRGYKFNRDEINER